jgi:cytidine deaminase
MEIRELILKAIVAKNNAYAPYSRFYVGASVLMEDDSVYTGCNVENASYGATNCAERTAIFNAVSQGHKYLKAICIVGDEEDYTFPCGICRQVMAEFSDDKTKIVIAKNENEYIIKSLREILPEAFTKKDL